MSDTPIMDAVDAKCDELCILDRVGYAVCEGKELEEKLNAANQRIQRLEREVEMLRLYGNKDCTAQADEALKEDKL